MPSPTEFQTAALAWIAVMAVVVPAALAVFLRILPMVNEIRAMLLVHDSKMTAQTERIVTLTKQVDGLSKPTPIRKREGQGGAG